MRTLIFGRMIVQKRKNKWKRILCFVFLFQVLLKEMRIGFNILLPNSSGGKFFVKSSASYNKLLDRTLSITLSNI